jgi:hypothetical protein
MINKSVMGLALAAVLASGGVAGSARAADNPGTLPEGSGVTTDLGGNASAVTYWVSEPEGWKVVTTIDSVIGGEAAPGEEKHAVVRFASVMLPGQSQVISVPEPVGSPSRELRIRRLGNRVEVGLLPRDSGT